ncbi:DoxX family membrane protein [Leptonema illini]|jgi:thiosulfate dehydrogenase [quinone] large subunit|uniref:DoxX family protein n=1 Tax=Leptonema illini DSM 21528 TaxID=929563 RepID=H2CIW8_9LEPT|nr:DoxX family membrane protein [Leptonema illini]EHQ08135.1 DoxX family protein [Leptonema illini DSM 21528]PKL34271.1 MAG: DoxX family protein [Spirochaetae bacterium HGW-Spirochaetae-10]
MSLIKKPETTEKALPTDSLAYLAGRLMIGMSMFGHGLVRIPKIPEFSDWMMHTFADSMVPTFIVQGFSTLLPIGELAVGVLLLLGFFTRQAALTGALLMSILIFGTCMIENWDAIGLQLLHGAFFLFLLYHRDENLLSLDAVFNKRTVA